MSSRATERRVFIAADHSAASALQLAGQRMLRALLPAERDRAAHRVRAYARVGVAFAELVLALRTVARLGDRRAEARGDAAAEGREVVVGRRRARERHRDRAARGRGLGAGTVAERAA